MADQPYTDEAHRPLSDEAIEQARRANARYEAHCNGEDDSDEARRQPMYWPETRWLATLDERTRERDAEAHAASNHAECAERMLRSACDLRDALDSVAAVLGVDTTTDASTEARACVAAVVALREEVDRLRSAVGGEQESAEQQRERAYAAERRAEEAEGRLAAAHRLVIRIDALEDNTVMPGDPDPRGLWCGLRSLLAPPEGESEHVRDADELPDARPTPKEASS